MCSSLSTQAWAPPSSSCSGRSSQLWRARPMVRGQVRAAVHPQPELLPPELLQRSSSGGRTRTGVRTHKCTCTRAHTHARARVHRQTTLDRATPLWPPDSHTKSCHRALGPQHQPPVPRTPTPLLQPTLRAHRESKCAGAAHLCALPPCSPLPLLPGRTHSCLQQPPALLTAVSLGLPGTGSRKEAAPLLGQAGKE